MVPGFSLSNSTIANPVAYPTDTTKYKVIISTSEGCRDSAFVTVNVWNKPVSFAGPDKKIFEGESVTLEGAASGAPYSYSWSPASFMNNATLLHPLVSPLSDITYTLSVQSTRGCGIATDKVFVRVYKKVTVPNAFSPNGDGINDTWQVQALETYPESITEVHNRYGQLVFRSTGYNVPWNGTYNNKPLASGTYYYVINLKNETPLLTGWVFIVK
jgi:gliding motility-associated-like protein